MVTEFRLQSTGTELHPITAVHTLLLYNYSLACVLYGRNLFFSNVEPPEGWDLNHKHHFVQPYE